MASEAVEAEGILITTYGTVDVDLSEVPGPAGSHFVAIDRLRAEHPLAWNTSGPGYWVLSAHGDIRAAARAPDVFSNHSIVAVDPDPPYRFLPSHADPPDHANYRHALNRWFAPQRIDAARPALRALVRRAIEDVRPDGGTDFMTSVGDRVTALSFLEVMGLPASDADLLISCAYRIAGGIHDVGDKGGPVGAMNDIKDYYRSLLADRRRRPLDTATDFVTYLLGASCGARDLDDDEMLDICMTLTFGSLDTTKSQMGWGLWHLARHPRDRRRIVEEPSIIPSAVEEFLRVFPIISMARKVTRDVDFQGCPMKSGDMVLLHMQAANRDPDLFDDPTSVRLDRTPNRHIAFGASAHRCLGSHLARAELQVVLEEWHRAIPEYSISGGEELPARNGTIALLSLPLVWSI